MSRISIAILAAALSLAAAFAAHAAGLGRMTVLSPLGQPLNAEIEVVSLRPGEDDGLVARLAPLEAFQEAGIEPGAALSSMRFAIERRGGRPIIRVTTTQAVNEPFVDLLVELQWNGGRLIREYTVLLDPPEYRGPETIAAQPARPEASAIETKPLPPVEARPVPPIEAAQPTETAQPTQTTQPSETTQPVSTPEPIQEAPLAAAPQAVEPPAEEPKPQPEATRLEPEAMKLEAPVAEPAEPQREATATKTHEVRRGDTLGEIARAHLPPGVTLNQMLIAIYRANQDAFIRENINLVRAGRILEIPNADTASALDVQEVNRLVQSHRGDFAEYRARLAAAPAPAERGSGEQAVSGKIEPSPAAAAPAPAPKDEVRLARADPAGGASGEQARAARGDDVAARERALKEAESRIADLEKNVADLQKLLELKNQQLAELERKAAAPKPAAVPVPAPTQAPAAGVTPKAAEASPVPQAAQPAPPPEVKKAEAPKPKPKAVAPPPPPAPSLLDELLENTTALAGFGLIVLLLAGYAFWAWRRKKASQDSREEPGFAPSDPDATVVGGAAAAGAQAGGASGGAEGDEVDPIAEADVYMAYGRDAQAEEILKDALQKDSTRLPVYGKLLEIYARRTDTRAFEETALKLRNLTNGTGPDWEKAAALGRSIDGGNNLYGGGAVATPAPVSAPAPALDFDVGGATMPGTRMPDISLDDRPKDSMATTVDFDLGAATVAPGAAEAKSDFTPEGTFVLDQTVTPSTGGLDFDLSGSEEKKEAQPVTAGAGEASGGLDFDLNLEAGASASAEAEKPIAPLDLSAISLDLGSAGEPSSLPASSNDPKWQEVATKLDLAKAYEEMGDKDGARELLNEVIKDGDAAQKGQAEQLLSKLG